MYEFVTYNGQSEDVWDRFVMEESINGTFLQTRRFLNYHPIGRFTDSSVLIYDKGKIVAVCPACTLFEDGRKIFCSHKGATFGGLVISRKYYRAERVMQMIQQLDRHLQDNGYKKCILKITPDLFSKENSSLLQYCLLNENYQFYAELNTYMDLNNLSDPVLSNFDRNKKRNIDKCEKEMLTFKSITEDGEIEDFYRLLKKNLEKYNLNPIHTIDEIVEFKNSRLVNETKFYGVFKGEEQLAGGMLFVFKQANVIHAQNLSADYTFRDYSPITYLYYKIIEKTKKEGFSKLSWGISTEHQGERLNLGLVRNKESYGSKYSLNTTFYKIY